MKFQVSSFKFQDSLVGPNEVKAAGYWVCLLPEERQPNSKRARMSKGEMPRAGKGYVSRASASGALEGLSAKCDRRDSVEIPTVRVGMVIFLSAN